MENHHFWAFFVIALIAGGAITLGLSNATMTGYAVQQEQLQPTFLERLFRPVTVEPAEPVITPAEVPINATTDCSDCQNVLDMFNECEFYLNTQTGWTCNDKCESIGGTCVLSELTERKGKEDVRRLTNCRYAQSVNQEQMCYCGLPPEEKIDMRVSQGSVFYCSCSGEGACEVKSMSGGYFCAKGSCKGTCGTQINNDVFSQYTPEANEDFIAALNVPIDQIKRIIPKEGADEIPLAKAEGNGLGVVFCSCVNGWSGCVFYESFPGLYKCKGCGGHCAYGGVGAKDMETID